MTTVKNAIIALFLITFITLLSSCHQEDITISPTRTCGESKLLGSLKFADSSLNFYSNWSGKEILVFKDSLGNESEFYSKSGKLFYDRQYVIKTHCYSSYTDKQEEYYKSDENYILQFVSRNPKNYQYFELHFHTDTIMVIDALIFYNLFSASYSNGVHFYTPIPTIKDKTANIQHKWYYNYSPKFVADTTILGVNLRDIYYVENKFMNSGIYFQKTNMIVAYRDSGITRVLDRIR